MIVDNLTTPGAQPSNGDLIRYTHPNGLVEEKTFLSIDTETPPIIEQPLTQFAWMRLFTFAEQVAIKTGAKTDTTLEVFL